MSGPDFEGVLAAHVLRQYDDPTACICGWNWDYRGVILPSAVDFDPFRIRLSDVVRPEQHRAHLSAALHAELTRWLDAEETWDRVWEAIAKVRDAHPRTVDDADSDDIATAALAALTTTDPNGAS